MSPNEMFLGDGWEKEQDKKISWLEINCFSQNISNHLQVILLMRKDPYKLVYNNNMF